MYYKTLLEAYKTASTAVHKGEVKFTDKNRQLLADAQALCRSSILKRLKKGKVPDWNALILGKKLDTAATNDDETCP